MSPQPAPAKAPARMRRNTDQSASRTQIPATAPATVVSPMNIIISRRPAVSSSAIAADYITGPLVASTGPIEKRAEDDHSGDLVDDLFAARAGDA